MATGRVKYLIGIDEVGRGSLAGPVTVVAVAIPHNFKFKIQNLKLRDSKKLSAKQREEIFRIIKKHPRVLHARANVYPRVIDRINISQAANLAATRAFARLITNNRKLITSKIKVFLDGGLFLSKSLVDRNKLLVRTIVRGDEKFNAIKLASIVAKVGRDRIVSRYDREFPKYEFAAHKGYGTRAHIKAIKKHGICDRHRLSFVKNFV